MSEQHQPAFEPVVDPPNGRVTQGELYRALHNMDLAYTERFNVILEAINDCRDDAQQLRKDLESLRDKTGNGSGPTIMIKLNKKAYTIGAGIVTGVAGAIAAIVTLIEKGVFG